MVSSCELTYDFTCLLYSATHILKSLLLITKGSGDVSFPSVITASYYKHTHTLRNPVCVCVCVFRHAADNVSECVLLTLSIVSSLIISPPPRHGHQLLRGAIIWNWFSPPTRSLAQNIKCSFGNMEEWKVMIKGCQQLKLNSSANICERHLFSSLPFSYCVRLPFAVLSTERLGGKTVGKALLFWAFTCLWVCLEGGGGGGWGGEDDREKKKPDGRNLCPPTQNPLC